MQSLDGAALVVDMHAGDIHRPIVTYDSQVHTLNAETASLFLASVEHGKTVGRNEALGSILSPSEGQVLCEVCSPVDGQPFALGEYPWLHEGSLMARIVATDT